MNIKVGDHLRFREGPYDVSWVIVEIKLSGEIMIFQTNQPPSVNNPFPTDIHTVNKLLEVFIPEDPESLVKSIIYAQENQ